VVTLERMLFDVNEAYHHMGLIADDKYITPTNLLLSAFVTGILMIGFVYIMRRDNFETIKRLNRKYGDALHLTILGVMVVVLYSLAGLWILSILILLFMGVHIIYKDARFIWLRKIIDKLF